MVPRPSIYILRKAWLLGQKMARKERRLRPDVRSAVHSPTYAMFKQAHRLSAERLAGFVYWDEKLRRLMEREGHGRGVRIDDPQVWDAFYTYYGEPIRNVFWAAWEDAHALKAMYERERARLPQSHLRIAAPDRMAAPASSSAEPPELWEQIEDKVLDELEDRDDGHRGAAPSADKLGSIGPQGDEKKSAAG